MKYKFCEIAEQYIKDVTTNEILVGNNARLAVERHLNDLKIADQKGWVFSKIKAEIFLTFISAMRHTKGKWARKPFNLTPDQAFIGYVLFGWQLKERSEEGRQLRRFSKAYIRTPRKWGKSEFAGAVGNYMFLADGEPGADVYCAATTFNQARKVFDPSASMMRMVSKEDADIRKQVKVFDSKNNCLMIYNDGEIKSEYKPISQDGKKNEEGSSPHCAIIDEYHLHPDNEMLDMLETGTGARENSLLFIITTAGFDLSSVCYEYDQTAISILKGHKEIDRTFVMIFDMDVEDYADWENPANWGKANSHSYLGLPPISKLMDELQKAKAEGWTKERSFRVKNLNQWLASQAGWIPDEYYKKAITDFSFDDMQGLPCFGGLDFAVVRDTNAVAYLFPPSDGCEKFRLKFRVFCPAAMIDDPTKNEGVNAYQRWEKEGHLIRTDGNAADFQAIVNDTLDITDTVEMEHMGYDRRFALNPVTKLSEEGIEMVEVSQNFQGQTVPIIQFEMLFLREMIEVEKNPLVKWQMGNVTLVHGDGDLVRISKQKSTGKIDAWAAAIDAMYVFCQRENINDNTSVWAWMAEKGILLT